MPLIYIALDPERATGIEDLFTTYTIVCPYQSALTDELEKRGIKVFILERDCPSENFEDALRGGTYGMMKLACVRELINATTSKGGSDPLRGVRPPTTETPCILVLKNSALIEQECAKNRWRLLAPRAEVAKKYEDKLTQFQALKDAAPFPPTQVVHMNAVASAAEHMGFPCVLQFNAGHSGGGTAILYAPEDAAPFLERYPSREVRIAKYIDGATYTLNAIVAKNGTIYTGFISKQLTGLPEATNNPSTTVGNDWTAAREELSQQQAEEIAGIAQKVGKCMGKDGYRGLFGIDVIVERGTGKVYLIEVNTHQPASISFEAKIHRAISKMPLMLLFLRDALENNSIPQKSELPSLLFPGHAKQVIYKNKSDKPISAMDIHAPEGAMMSRMKTVKPNEELYRVQKFNA